MTEKACAVIVSFFFLLLSVACIVVAMVNEGTELGYMWGWASVWSALAGLIVIVLTHWAFDIGDK